MTAQELKKYIVKQSRYIEQILEKVNCHSIKEYPSEYRAALPERNNPTAVVVKKDTLSVRIYTGGETINGDIYVLVGEIMGLEFKESLKFCHAVLGLEYTGFVKTEKKEHPLDILRKHVRKRRHKRELETYPVSILDEYVNMPHFNFFLDGIMPQIQKEYGICYSIQDQRIVIPHYKHDDITKIVGLVGRTTVEHHEMFLIPKYFNLISGYEKNQNLYGLSHNLEHIKKAGRVIVFEAEKSVLQLATMGDRTGVAVGSHEITDIQRKLLIELDVEIIIAFDKDVSLEHIQETCDKMRHFRKVSYIHDKYGLLDAKDSPTDKGYKVWNYLLRYRTK